METILVKDAEGKLVELIVYGRTIRGVTEKPEPKSEDVEWAGHTWKLNAEDGDLNLTKDGDGFLWLENAENGRAKLRLMGPAKVDL